MWVVWGPFPWTLYIPEWHTLVNPGINCRMLRATRFQGTPQCANGWMEGFTTIAEGLNTHKVCVRVVSLSPYDGVEPFLAVATLKHGDHACQYCHMHVSGKELMLHVVFHIGCGEAVGSCPPCLFYGRTDGACQLQMSKVRCGDARWQIAPTS